MHGRALGYIKQSDVLPSHIFELCEIFPCLFKGVEAPVIRVYDTTRDTITILVVFHNSRTKLIEIPTREGED